MVSKIVRLPEETTRLFFRSWREEDLPLAQRLWGDPRVTALISSVPLDDAGVKERLATEIKREREVGVQYWPIFLRATSENIGCCGLKPYQLDKQVYEIGFHLNFDFWRKGLAYEAAQSVLTLAFGPLDVATLFAGHHPQNVASQRTLQKLGFLYTHDELFSGTGLLHRSYWLSAERFRRST